MINMKILLTRLKILLLRKETIFWILLFPILLASAEYLAFNNVINATEIEQINVGVIEDEDYKINDVLNEVIKNAMIDDDTKLYNTTSYKTYDDAYKGLENKDVTILLYKENNSTTIYSRDSINSSITYSIINQTETVINTITKAHQKYYTDLAQGLNPTPVNEKEIQESLLSDINYFIDESNNKSAGYMIIYFYTLIALSCLYAAFMGVSMMNDLRADRSSLGIRITTTVVSKPKLTGIYFLASVIFEAISSVIISLFFNYVLNITLGTPLLVILSIFVGGITGLALGMLVGVFVGGSDKVREGVVSTGVLVFCILSGMMSTEIKNVINQNLPWFNYINPAALITDSLYSLYIYDTYTKYIICMSIMGVFILISLLLIFIKTRGEKYASL